MAMSRSLRISSLLVLVTAVVLGVYLKFLKKPPPYLPWHESPAWKDFLAVYDTLRSEQYENKPYPCQSLQINTKFGTTQTYACGDASHPAVFLLHGASSNAMIYGDWMVPLLVKAQQYAVAVDFPCDVGRSIPPDGDPAKCPENEQQLADWLMQVSQGMGLQQERFNVLGYSYGCLVAFSAARFYPDKVNKVVLLAPAAPFAPLNPGFIIRGILSTLIPTKGMRNWFFSYMSADPNFDMDTWRQLDRDHLDTMGRVGGTILSVPAGPVEDDVLKEVIGSHPTMLGIGEEETLVNMTLAVERASHAGAQVKVFPKAGHLMLIEEALSGDRPVIVDEVVRFLTEKKEEEEEEEEVVLVNEASVETE